MNGIFVAISVMNWTFASSGRLAMYTIASATCSTSIIGSPRVLPSGCRAPTASMLASSVAALPMSIWLHAITGLTKSTSLDGRQSDIACSQIDIGNAATELASMLAGGALQPDGSTRGEPMMDVEHVADAVVYMANLPLDANVQFMTLMATKMPFIGRG